MTQPRTSTRPAEDHADDAGPNLVRLRGRVTTNPTERELPSGSRIVTFRISVGRDPSPMTKSSRQTSDWVDCSAWGSRVRRTVSRWDVGDVVELEGALRRRFFRAGDAPSTRLEVEVLRARLTSRGPTRTTG